MELDNPTNPTQSVSGIWKIIISESPEPTTAIPSFDEEHLQKVADSLDISDRLFLDFHSILQTYLNTKEYKHYHVLMLIDVALMVSLRYIKTHKETKSKPMKTEMYCLVIDLFDSFCAFLTCNKLDSIVNYCVNRTQHLCKLSDSIRESFNKSITERLELKMLKFCNTFLARLNQSRSDVQKRGKFLIFMANFVDIDSRSGVNLHGRFCVENVTNFTPIQSIEEGIVSDKALYQSIWRLQDVFRDPRNLALKTERFRQFQKDLDLVLDMFAKNELSRKSSKIRNETLAGFDCKYLTSPRLFDQQLNDPYFRRNILVQSMILLKSHFVTLTKPEKSNLKLNANDMQWAIDSYHKIVNKILPKIPPNGRNFKKFIKCLLDGDESWMQWKHNSSVRCKPLKHKKRMKLSTKSLPPKSNGNGNGNKAKSFAVQQPPRKKQKRLSTDIPMGDDKLHILFKATPECMRYADWNDMMGTNYGSNGNNDNDNNNKNMEIDANDHYKDKNNTEYMDLSFLQEHLIDAKKKLTDDLDYYLEVYKERKESKSENASSTNPSFCKPMSRFKTLRLIRDVHSKMFGALCPSASNPKPDSPFGDFIIEALRYHSPQSFPKPIVKAEKVVASPPNKTNRSVTNNNNVSPTAKLQTKNGESSALPSQSQSQSQANNGKGYSKTSSNGRIRSQDSMNRSRTDRMANGHGHNNGHGYSSNHRHYHNGSKSSSSGSSRSAKTSMSSSNRHSPNGMKSSSNRNVSNHNGTKTRNGGYQDRSGSSNKKYGHASSSKGGTSRKVSSNKTINLQTAGVTRKQKDEHEKLLDRRKRFAVNDKKAMATGDNERSHHRRR